MSVGVMVLAAGVGSRLGVATGGLPKPLVAVAGRPPLQRALAWLSASGLEQVWINVHYQPASIRAAVAAQAAGGLEVHFSEEATLLGTAGGWARVVGLAPEPERWLVLYGDNVMRFDLGGFLARHEAARSGGALATVALFDPARHRNTGIAGGGALLADGARVEAFVEGALPADALVNAGAYVLERDVVRQVPPAPADFGRDVLPRLAAAGQLAGHILEDGAYCLGVDTPERLQIAARMLEAEVL